jgi:hypothetical protein
MPPQTRSRRYRLHGSSGFSGDGKTGASPDRRSTSHGGVSGASNHWLKWILIEAVQTLKQVPGPVRFHYERLLRAKGKPKATVAAARKLCTYIYWMWRQELRCGLAQDRDEAGGVPDAYAGVVRLGSRNRR